MIMNRRVEAMEKQLKKDVLAEAKASGGGVLLHDEVRVISLLHNSHGNESS